MDQMQISDASGSPGLPQRELFSSHGETGEQGSISLTKLQDLMTASSEQKSLLMQSCCGLQVTLGGGVGSAYWQGKQPEERTGEGMMRGTWVMGRDWLEQHRGRNQREVSCMGPVCGVEHADWGASQRNAVALVGLGGMMLETLKRSLGRQGC